MSPEFNIQDPDWRLKKELEEVNRSLPRPSFEGLCATCRRWAYGHCSELKLDIGATTEACEKYVEISTYEPVRPNTCGACANRINGYCEGTAWNGKELVPYRESVDHDEPACTRYKLNKKIKFKRPRKIPMVDPKLTKRVYQCGECVFYVFGFCFHKSNKTKEGQLKVSPNARACDNATSLLEVRE